MTARVAQIWRHPIKSHGHEALAQIAVTEGRTLPYDRTWAIAHDAAKTDGTEWAPCANFSRGAKAPGLMAIDASLDDASETVTLRHPDRPDFAGHPEQDAAALIEWTQPLVPTDRAAPAAVLRVPDRGMTDTPFPSISLGGLSSLRALSDKVGRPLDPRRFRMNFWLEGLGPWEEFEWIGRDITIGEVRFRVEEPIERCLATTANPETGRRDADTLGALEAGWGHREFGIYLTALTSGPVAVGDEAGL